MTSDSAFFLLSRSHTRECRTRELPAKPAKAAAATLDRENVALLGMLMFCCRTHSNVAAMGAERAWNAIAPDSRATHARLSDCRAGLTLLFRARSPSSGWMMLGKCCCYWCSCYFHSCTKELLTFRHNPALHFDFRPFFTCQSKIVIHSRLYWVDRNVLLFMHSNFH